MSRGNRNLLIPRRVRSAAFIGAAGRSAPQFLPDGTELRKRVWSAHCYFSGSTARDPAREQFPLALTNFKKLSEKHSPPCDKATATLNPWETLDRNQTKRGVLQIPAQSPIFKPGWVMLVVDTSQSMSSLPFGVNPHLVNVKCSGSEVVDGQTVSIADLPPGEHLTGKTALDVAKVEAIEFANKARAQRYLTGLVSFDDK